ncbi:MAG TPA: CPBP family intramembrane glutamic endopeptidase [Gemmatimonadales bacterium]|nr:CPBP family intramembrane glutamic endopeptidase [Gemmatimonadales bacterium]
MLAWGLGRWLDISPLDRLQFDLEGAALGVAATGPMLLGLAWTVTTIWRPARELVALVTDQLGPLLAGCSVLQLALLAALAGVAEEILFRGVVQAGLVRVVSVPVGLVAASVLFGLAHFASRAYAALATVLGVYLGALFLLQGNLLVPIIAHALYDFVALNYLVRRHRASHLPA